MNEGLASCCEVIPLLSDEDSSYTKQTLAHFVLSFHVGTTQPHTAPYRLLKAAGCTVSSQQRWQLSVILSLQVKLGSQSWLWQGPLWQGLRFSKPEWQLHVWSTGSKKSRGQGNILSLMCVSVCLPVQICKTSCTDGVNKNWFYSLGRNSAIILRVSLPSAASLCTGSVSYILYGCWLGKTCLARKLLSHWYKL